MLHDEHCFSFAFLACFCWFFLALAAGLAHCFTFTPISQETASRLDSCRDTVNMFLHLRLINAGEVQKLVQTRAVRNSS
jgi:hypothetical protein